MTKNPNAVELGRRGGQALTERQQLARRRNILKALAKQHPHSVKIQQELQRLNEEQSAHKEISPEAKSG